MGRAHCLGQLGSVAKDRFMEARKANQPPQECLGHLTKAEQYYKQALAMFPAGAVEGLAITHNQLGLIYAYAGQIDLALRHYREAIRYKENMQDRFGAGQTRHNAALALARTGRFDDAHEWAQAALRDHQAAGNADQEVVETLRLLEWIESSLQASSPRS